MWRPYEEVDTGEEAMHWHGDMEDGSGHPTQLKKLTLCVL